MPGLAEALYAEHPELKPIDEARAAQYRAECEADPTPPIEIPSFLGNDGPTLMDRLRAWLARAR